MTAVDPLTPSRAPSLGPDLDARLDAAQARIAALGSVLVAVSGGADSALVVALAGRALGGRAAAAMGVSAAYPAEELDWARRVCDQLGVPLHEVPTHQLEDASFLRNDAERCFHCRDELYRGLRPLADSLGLAALCDGTNADDLGDLRPGLRATRRAGVVSPLADAGITKEQVRAASRAWRLPTWDKPQQACLSSRIPRGTPITVAALRRVEEAERWLRDRGIRQLRVREHGDVARIECEDPADIARLAGPPLREACSRALRSLGYAAVSVDLEPFATGRLARLDAAAGPAT